MAPYKVTSFSGPLPRLVAPAFEGLVLRDPNQWLTLDTEPNVSIGQGGVMVADGMSPLRHRLTGRISGRPQDRPATGVRLFALYGKETRETELSNTGIFEFAEAPEGRYGLLGRQRKR